MKKLQNKLVKKLGKKGFTLIELLAVIVILAIVMVIAIPNVLNSINNSRLSSLNSEAKGVVSSYNAAYLSSQITTDTNNVFYIMLQSLNSMPKGTTTNAGKYKTDQCGNDKVGWVCIGAVKNFASWAGLNSSDYVLGAATGYTVPVCTKGAADASGYMKHSVVNFPKGTRHDTKYCSAVRRRSDGVIEIVLVANKTGKFHVGGSDLTYAYSGSANGYAVSD